jgi:hypothetical protein
MNLLFCIDYIFITVKYNGSYNGSMLVKLNFAQFFKLSYLTFQKVPIMQSEFNYIADYLWSHLNLYQIIFNSGPVE